jgi:maltose-binding protein MalE
MTQDQARPASPGTPDDAQISRRRFIQLGGAVAAGLGIPLLSSCTSTGSINSGSGASSTAGRGASSAAAAPSSSAAGGGATSGGSFTWYTSNNHVYDTWKNIISKFEQDHNVSVNWQKMPFTDMQTKLQADFAAGTVPDLVEYTTGDATMQFVVTGDVMALDDFIAKDGEAMGYPDDWQTQAVKSWQHDGKTYGVQLQLTAEQLYYNKKMLSDAGISAPPQTWDDFLAAAQKLTSKNVYGVALNADYSYSEPWVLQTNAQLYDPTGKQFLAPRANAQSCTAVPPGSRAQVQGFSHSADGLGLHDLPAALHRESCGDDHHWPVGHQADPHGQPEPRFRREPAPQEGHDGYHLRREWRVHPIEVEAA